MAEPHSFMLDIKRTLLLMANKIIKRSVVPPHNVRAYLAIHRAKARGYHEGCGSATLSEIYVVILFV